MKAHWIVPYCAGSSRQSTLCGIECYPSSRTGEANTVAGGCIDFVTRADKVTCVRCKKLLALGAQRKQRDTREIEQRMAARRLGFTS